MTYGLSGAAPGLTRLPSLEARPPPAPVIHCHQRAYTMVPGAPLAQDQLGLHSRHHGNGCWRGMRCSGPLCIHGEQWPRRYCGLCKKTQVVRHGRCCGHNPDVPDNLMATPTAGEAGPAGDTTGEAGLGPLVAEGAAHVDPLGIVTGMRRLAHAAGGAPEPPREPGQSGALRILRPCEEECWLCTARGGPISRCCSIAHIPHLDHTCMWCRDWSIPPSTPHQPAHEPAMAALGAQLPGRALRFVRADETQAYDEDSPRLDPDLLDAGALVPRLIRISDPELAAGCWASGAPTLLRQLSRELALAAPAVRAAMGWNTEPGPGMLPRPWTALWSKAVLWEPHFPYSPHLPGRPNAVLPTRSYLGLTLAPRGASTPWSPENQLAPTLTFYADDVIMHGERRAVLSLACLASGEWAEHGGDVGTVTDDASPRAARDDDSGPGARAPTPTGTRLETASPAPPTTPPRTTHCRLALMRRAPVRTWPARGEPVNRVTNAAVDPITVTAALGSGQTLCIRGGRSDTVDSRLAVLICTAQRLDVPAVCVVLTWTSPTTAEYVICAHDAGLDWFNTHDASAYTCDDCGDSCEDADLSPDHGARERSCIRCTPCSICVSCSVPVAAQAGYDPIQVCLTCATDAEAALLPEGKQRRRLLVTELSARRARSGAWRGLVEVD